MPLGHVEGRQEEGRGERGGGGGWGCGAGHVTAKAYLARGWYLVHICNEIHDKWSGRLLQDLLGSSHLFNSAPALQPC